MRPLSRDTAFARRDYWILVPAGCLWVHMVYRYVTGSETTTAWIGGAVGLCIWSAVLVLPVVYSRWALWVISGVWVMSVGGSLAEILIGGDPWASWVLPLGLLTVLSAVLWARRVLNWEHRGPRT